MGIVVVVEIVADKVPAVDHALHSFLVLVGRAITRITSTGTTAGLANPFISLCEDAVVVVLAIVCFAVGTIAVLVAVSLIIFAIWGAVKKRQRTARRRATTGEDASLGGRLAPSDGSARDVSIADPVLPVASAPPAYVEPL